MVGQEARWWRPLRPEEENVQFAAIEARLDAAVESLSRILGEVLGSVHEAVVQVVLGIPLAERMDWDRLRTITVSAGMAEYRREIKRHLNTIYQFSKARAAIEWGIQTPETSRHFIQWMESKSQILAAMHAAVLEQRVRNTVVGARPDADLEASVDRVFDDFVENEIPRGADLTATLALQAGRSDARRAADGVERLTWSAILDHRTCETCRQLDGVTWWADDGTIIWPPIHFWCRCLLVGTLVTAPYKPDVTGLPAGFVLPPVHQRFVEALGAFRA